MTRSLHLWTGLFVSPFLIIFALSAIALNHAVLPWGGGDAVERRSVSIGPQPDLDSFELAKRLRAQLGFSGEIGFVVREEPENRLSFPVELPGRTTRVDVDLARGTASIESRDTGFWDAVIRLHKQPGPHNVALRGNWAPMAAWAWFADLTVYLLLFSTASGVFLWTALRSERPAGLLLIGAGAVSLVVTVFALVGS